MLLIGGVVLQARILPASVEPIACPVHPGSIAVSGGSIRLGLDGVADEGVGIRVNSFDIDQQEVTVAKFARFVRATGYRTTAEVQGYGAVFRPVRQPSGDGAMSWWHFVEGADWRRPSGPDGPMAAINEPVVQVTLADAQAYAKWAARSLPTEAEWEYAARGGDDMPRLPRQWAYDAHGKPVANTWQGFFPFENENTDGHEGVSPVGCFPPNLFGLQDMIGNVWEWTDDGEGNSVIKGGSYLCSFNYCSNFKPAARLAQEADLPTSHIGFRTITRTGETGKRSNASLR